MLAQRAAYVPQFARRRPVRIGTSGSLTTDLLAANTVDEVDAVFRKRLKAGDIPSWIKEDWWVPVVIKGGGHTLELLVAPDYAAVGSDDDFIRLGKTSEYFAQEYAEAFDAVLPSQKLLLDIENAASVQVPYIAVQKAGKADDSTAAVIKANDLLDAAYAKAGASNDDGKLKVSGSRKAYVVRPGLNGDYIAIFGGRWTPRGATVQPTSGKAHTTGRISGTPNYSDASHGVVLISRKAKLDGKWVDLRMDVFGSKDPSVVALVSNEGRFDPVFPNAGPASVAEFSVVGNAPKGSVTPYKPGTFKPSGGNAGLWLVGGVAVAAGAVYLAVA